MSDAQKVEIGSALIGAQNALCYFTSYAPESMLGSIEVEQDKIRRAIEVLGGIDHLIEIGV